MPGSANQRRPAPSRPQSQSQSQQNRPPYGFPHQQQQQQQQQQQLHPHAYYTSSPTAPSADHPFPLSRNHSSLSSGSAQGLTPFAASSPQHPPNFVGQYTIPTSAPLYTPQQYAYSQPAVQIPGLPPLSHSHSTSPMTFGVGVSMSMGPSHPGMYAPSYAPSPIRPAYNQQDHTPSPPGGYDVAASQTGPGPPHSAASPASAAPSYTQSPQQPFPLYNYGQPQLTTTPQFPPYASPFQAPPPHSRSPYPASTYAYMTASSPTGADDNSTGAPMAWWYVSPSTSGPSSSTNTPAASGTTPYVYYVDAYGNPAPPPLGPAPGYTGPSSVVNRPPMHDVSALTSSIAFPTGPGPGSAAGPGTSRAGSSTSAGSSRDPHLPFGNSASDRAVSVTSARGDAQQPLGTAAPRRQGNTNANVQRSEWVMWVGNVPGDATHDELWRFFTAPNLLGAPGQRTSATSQQYVPPPSIPQQPQPPHLLPSGLLSPAGSSSASSAHTPYSATDPSAASVASGVASIFLIARSNCAFVNYVTSQHLSAAVAHFNGMQLRPGDPRCPRLVCRVRGKDEDQRAGVGGQRGAGIHTRWVRQQRERGNDMDRVTGREVEEDAAGAGEARAVGESEGDSAGGMIRRGRRPPHHSSSSGSTTSGFLQKHFPKRYFILKSLTQFDLDLSVKRGLWATQPHNETVLNQAYRTSQDVYLIFGVNKSGEFFGYARMAGPIGKAEEKVSWASRTDSAHSHSPAASMSSIANFSTLSETIPEENESPSPDKEASDLPPLNADTQKQKQRRHGLQDTEKPPIMLFSPDHQAVDSPQPVTKGEERKLETEVASASASASGLKSGQPKRQRSREVSTAPPVSERKGARAPWSLRPASPPTSAPAIMGRPAHAQRSEEREIRPAAGTLDPRLLTHHPSIPLNPEAPKLAMRENQGSGSGSPHVHGQEKSGQEGEGEGSGQYVDEEGIKRRDMHDSSTSSGKLRISHSLSHSSNQTELPPPSGRKPSSVSQSGLPPPFQPGYYEREGQSQSQTPQQGPLSGEGGEDPQWGTPFKVQWIKVTKLPFHRTRHLRNPWNHEREVKVSRDGTELEPGVGQALLEEWEKEREEGEEGAVHPPEVVPDGSGSVGVGVSAGVPISISRRASEQPQPQPQPHAHIRRRTQPAPAANTHAHTYSPASASVSVSPDRVPGTGNGSGNVQHPGPGQHAHAASAPPRSPFPRPNPSRGRP